MKRIAWLLMTCAVLSAGQALAQGVTSTEIVIGQVNGFTGPAAGPVKELAAGADLYVEWVNANGGVNGRKIRLEKVDDTFDPKKSGEVARMLIKDKGVFALFLTRGTPHTEAILAVAKEAGVPMIAPSTGAMLLHTPVNPLVFNVRSTYQAEAERAIVQLAGQGIKKVAVIHVDDSFGKDGLAGYEKGFKATNKQPLGVFKFDRATSDVKEAVAKALALEPEAIVTAGSAKAISNIVKEARGKGSNVSIITLSNNSAQSFIKDLGEFAHGVIVMQVFPNPATQTSPLSMEIQRLAANKKDFPLSHAAVEGFVAAKVLVEGLKRAGKNPTRASFMTALESIKDYDLGGGLKVGYSPNDRTGLSFVESSIINKKGTFTQ